MSISAIPAAANPAAASHQAAQSTGHHKHNGRRIPSLTDIDAQGSSVASPPSSTGKVGSRINITA